MMNQIDNIKTLAKQMIEQNTDAHSLPILKINKMNCDVEFSKNDNDFDLEIYSTDIRQDEDCSEPPYSLYGTSISYGAAETNEDKYVEALTVAIETIKALKYDNFEGCLKIEQPDENPTHLIWQSIMEKADVELTHGDCVVCFEKTQTKTTCNHCVCIMCCSKVKTNDDYVKPCPICREPLYVKNE